MDAHKPVYESLHLGGGVSVQVGALDLSVSCPGSGQFFYI